MKTKILSILLLAALVSVTGCKKFLEQEPDNRTNVVTGEQIRQLLVSAYPKASYFAFCEAMSDNVEDKGQTEPGLDPEFVKMNLQSYLFQEVQSIGKDAPEAYWDSCYRAIAAANKALEVIRVSADSTAFNAQKGEALVARAYAHFMLVTLFSRAYNPPTAATDPGIPYVTESERDVFGSYQRKTVQYVYEMIEKDLTTGLPLINDGIYGSVPKFHFTKNAANAFASRFYLFKRDYAKVVQHANRALTGTVADNLRPWNTTYQNLQYYDLQQTYSKAEERANILLQETATRWDAAYIAYARFSIFTEVHSTVLNGSNPTGGTYAIGYKVFGSSPQYYNVPKLSTSNGYGVIPLLTAEEVVLNRAEAYARQQNFDAALADLNAWASKNIRNYIPSIHVLTQSKVETFYNLPVQDALISTVLAFKRVFFIHEGLRWFDIIRLNIPVTHRTADGRTITLAANDRRRLLQLPPQVVASGVEQNPR